MDERGESAALGNSALTHGLEVLRLLAVSPRPMTSTELAARLNLHQSTVSRILKTLSAAGYVRKPDYHSFAVDYGVLTLAGNANAQFPLTTLPRAAMLELAERCGGLTVSLATLWRGDLVYFLRAQKGHELITATATGYPLHLSSVALLLLLDMPLEQALKILEESRRRHGWDRPMPAVPESSAQSLELARELLRDECLMLNEFQKPKWLSASIRIEVNAQPPFCLAISGPCGTLRPERISALLKNGRAAVEESLR